MWAINAARASSPAAARSSPIRNHSVDRFDLLDDIRFNFGTGFNSISTAIFPVKIVAK